MPTARPEQAHVVVDLGDGADRRARVLGGGLLLDGDGRREAVDLVDIRLLHHLQELSGIGRERLDVAALTLGIDGIEGERRLAGTGQAGEHHELVPRHHEVDVLQVVLPRPAHGDHTRIRIARLGAVEQVVEFSHRQLKPSKGGDSASSGGNRIYVSRRLVTQPGGPTQVGLILEQREYAKQGDREGE